MNYKVKIKCYLYSNINNIHFHIKVFDSANCLIADGLTNDFKELEFNVKKFGLYKIVIIPKPFLIPNYVAKYITINKDTNVLTFKFNINDYIEHPIIFKLTDRYYKDLPILKGDIDLWQKNI